MLSRPPVELPSSSGVLRRLGLGGRGERRFVNDGWSGAELSLVARGRDRFVIKRDSLARDWIARATRDGPILREAWFAAAGPRVPGPLSLPYLGVGRDGEEFVMVMPDLTGTLIEWESPIDVEMLDRVLDAIVAFHTHPWPDEKLEPGFGPWCPLPERLLLTSRRFAQGYLVQGGAATTSGERLLSGWDAFDRHAQPAARDLIRDLTADVSPLVTALEEEPATLLHGDLKLANLGIAADGSVPAVDWQMVMVGPVALELGWFLVSNSASLPLPPERVLDRYRARASFGDRAADLARIVGLVLRGFRKGQDAAAGATLASGVSGADDLAEWCAAAIEAARRRL